MRMTLRLVGQRLLLIPCATALLTVGCGEGHILQSPTGPSGTLGSTTFLTDAGDGPATAASAGEFDTLAKGGNGNGGGKGKDKPGNDDPSDAAPDEDRGRRPNDAGGPGRSGEDRVVGFVGAKAGDTITVNGVTIAAGLDAVIRHGNRILTMAHIAVGDHVQARGTMEGTTLIATEIKVQDTGNDNEDPDTNAAELEGAISGLSPLAGCPVVTFMIGTTQVTTSATTVFDDVTCATLADTKLVEVEGTRQADGSILATRVELEAGPDEVIGTVFELTGTATCAMPSAALTFKVGPAASLATTVKTTASTTFTGVTCAALANGATVEVEGTTQADGSITAASVELH